MSTKLDLEAILARCRAATAGPWYVVGPPWRARWFDKSIQMYRDVPTYVVAGREDPHVGKPVCEAPDIEEWPSDDADVPPEQTYEGMVEQGDADLKFIANARTDVPLLVHEIERLRASDKYHRDTIAKCNSHIYEQEQEIERLRAERDDATREATELRKEATYAFLAGRGSRLAELAKQQVEIERLQRAAYGGEGVWLWQGDGTDHPESLSCQVLMTAYQLRELIDSISRLQAEIERLQGYKREFERALHYVDRCPILPHFCRIGDDKFEAVVKLANKYRDLVEYLDDPNVLLAIPQPHRMTLSQLLHGDPNS